MSTYATNVLLLSSTPINDKVMLSPYTHGEEDTRVMLHVLHSVCQGFENICVRTVDTDVVVLAVGSVNELKTVEGSQCKLEQLRLVLALVKVRPTAIFLPTQLPVQINPELCRWYMP